MKISCLCITRGEPWPLRRALDCFGKQTYADRELVIVHQGLDEVMIGAIMRLQTKVVGRGVTVRTIDAPSELKLGQLRNLALEKAEGELVAQWDDDDWYAPTRLEEQYLHCRDDLVPACLLTQWYILDETTGNVYLSFERREGWEGSMLVRREAALRIGYPPHERGEDSPFVASYQRRYGCRLIKMPELYVYCYTGQNTWDRAHWERLIARSSEVAEPIRTKILQKMGDETINRLEWLRQEKEEQCQEANS